jgi:hypothetical protein
MPSLAPGRCATDRALLRSGPGRCLTSVGLPSIVTVLGVGDSLRSASVAGVEAGAVRGRDTDVMIGVVPNRCAFRIFPEVQNGRRHMIGRLSRVLALAGLGGLLLFPNACSKRVPLETPFEAQQKVILTMKDGRSLRGRIAPGQRVEYRQDGSTYRADVTAVTADSIRLGQILLLDDGKYEALGRRLADGQVVVAPPLPSLSIPRGEVTKVELQMFDGSRTARSLGAWVYGSALLLMLLGERS